MIAATVVVIIGMIGIGFWVTDRILDGIKDHAAAVTALHVDGIVAPLAVKLLNQSSLDPEDRLALNQRLARGVLNKDLFAFKIWKPNGEVVFSSDPALIGQRYAVTEGLAEAASGRLHAEFDELNNPESAGERRAGVPLIEIYSPVLDPESGRVVGIVEFYEAATELADELARARTQTWLVVGALTAGMLSLLYGIVARGGRLIDTQRDRLANQVAELSSLLDQNRNLQRNVETANRRAASLNERYLRRISAELHDGPLQLLAFASLRLGNPRADIGEVKSAIEDASREIRNVSSGLTLPELESLSTEATIRRAVSAHERRTGARCEVILPDALPTLPQAERICIYRFVQEGLNNVERHAGASKATVRMSSLASSIEVSVEDGGAGFDPQGDTEGLGLSGLRERALGLGGELTVESKPGGGTRLTLRLPLGGPS